MVNNITATNIPFESNNFAHLLVDKENGLVATMNVSIDNTNNDKEVMGLDALLQIDPKDMEARATLSINTPFLDGEVDAEAKMPTKGQMETRVTTKTEADSSTYDSLTHKMESVMKVSPTKMTQTIRFKHPKLDSDFKLQFDLHGQGGADFARLEQDEDEDQEDTSMERSKNRHVQAGPSSHGRKSQSDRHTARDSENQGRFGQEGNNSLRQRSPRSVSRNDRAERENHGSRDPREQREGRDNREDGEGRDEMRSSR